MDGGFAPYGYYLKDNHLLIEEKEAEAIRIIFDKFGNSDIGLGGVAKYLNLQRDKEDTPPEWKVRNMEQSFNTADIRQPCLLRKNCIWQKNTGKSQRNKNEYKSRFIPMIIF